MSEKIYVGNLSFSTSSETLESVFGAYGNVAGATVITDRDTGKSKGFGFVEFDDEASAQKAIAALNGRELDGRRIRVSEAQTRPPSQQGGESFRTSSRPSFNCPRKNHPLAQNPDEY